MNDAMEQIVNEEKDTPGLVTLKSEQARPVNAKWSSVVFEDNGIESEANIMRFCVRKNYISKKTGCVNTDIFECRICKKQMRQLCNFKSHLRVHLKLKPFKCPTCGRGFATRSNCNHHVQKGVCQRRIQAQAQVE